MDLEFLFEARRGTRIQDFGSAGDGIAHANLPEFSLNSQRLLRSVDNLHDCVTSMRKRS